MNAVNTPTPDNILSITYQLLQEPNVPGSIRGQMPVITIQFQENSVVRNKVVGFVEMLPYLKMLKKRADGLGKVITSNPAATFDKKIIINYGDPAVGFPIAVQLALAPNDPCAQIPTVIFLDHAAPMVVGDTLWLDDSNTLPVVGFDLVANVNTGVIYALDPVTGVVGAVTGNSCIAPPVPPVPGTITMKLNGVNFDGAKNLLAQFNCAIAGTDTINASNLPCVFSFTLPCRGFGAFDDDYDYFAYNMYIEAYRDLASNTWSCVGSFLSPGGAQIVDIVNADTANQKTIKLTTDLSAGGGQFDYINVIPFTGALGADSLQIGGTYKDLQDQSIPAYCGKIAGVAGNVYHIIGTTTFANPSYCLVTFKKLGVFVASKQYPCDAVNNNFDIADVDLPAFADYDEINFTFIDGTGGAGLPVSAAVAVLEVNVCAAPIMTFYTIDGTLTPGNVLFDDIAMTTPHAGDSFMLNANTSSIFAIDNVTGVIGAATGNSC